MKKIKIMLTAIAIMAAVGGALAYKAKGTNVYCGLKGAACNTANCSFQSRTTFVAATTGTLYCTEAGISPCNCNVRAASAPND
jgi:hypothetical protein